MLILKWEIINDGKSILFASLRICHNYSRSIMIMIMTAITTLIVTITAFSISTTAAAALILYTGTTAIIIEKKHIQILLKTQINYYPPATDNIPAKACVIIPYQSDSMRLSCT
jgi:hypothetical protein